MAEIKLKKRYKYAGDIFQKLIGIGFDVETATAFLNEVEDADVVEVKHGYWIDYSDDFYRGRRMDLRCSICHNRASAFVGGTDDWWDNRKPNYCPHCGAKMDGERNKVK